MTADLNCSDSQLVLRSLPHEPREHVFAGLEVFLEDNSIAIRNACSARISRGGKRRQVLTQQIFVIAAKLY